MWFKSRVYNHSSALSCTQCLWGLILETAASHNHPPNWPIFYEDVFLEIYSSTHSLQPFFMARIINSCSESNYSVIVFLVQRIMCVKYNIGRITWQHLSGFYILLNIMPHILHKLIQGPKAVWILQCVICDTAVTILILVYHNLWKILYFGKCVSLYY